MMSTESEFLRWLHREEKTFSENLQFAIRAWKSIEFTLPSKYEIVLNWLVEQKQKQIYEQGFPEMEFRELLQLRGQPGLVSQQTKHAFIEMMLAMAGENIKQDCNTEPTTRMWPDLLQHLIEFELVQDLYRADYELHSRIYATLFKSYRIYLNEYGKSNKNPDPVLPAGEIQFFAAVLHSLKESIRRVGNVVLYESSYTKYSLQALVEVLLILRTYSVDFFDELLELERTLCSDHSETWLLRRILQLPLHVSLLTLECAIVNRRGVEIFVQTLLQELFRDLMANAKVEQPVLGLTVAAYTIEMLRKHDVNLNIKVTDEQTAIGYLGTQIFSCVSKYKESNIREVLTLLCAVLRLNPLILEKHIFEVTIWMIVATKSCECKEQQLFEEFLILLIDMFRRLSRIEKFVVNLLKSLREWLHSHKLNDGTKRKSREMTEQIPSKRQKSIKSVVATFSDENEKYSDVYMEILLGDLFKLILKERDENPIPAIGATHSFSKLKSAWPSGSVGVEFSKLISGLMSKPSLVVCKSLLYSLKELLESLEAKSSLDENALFQLDFNAALLCQYFAGCKIAEQLDKYNKEICAQRDLTRQVLATFGGFLLNHEHNQRIMNAFLECVYYAACLDLLLGYYPPDGFTDCNLQCLYSVEQLHGFLTTEAWTLIQQRVLNFGDSSCKYLLNRLILQQRQAELLFSQTSSSLTKINLQQTFLTSTTYDQEEVKLLLNTPDMKWLVSQLKRSEKVIVAKELLKKPDYLNICTDDLELLEFTALAVYEQLAKVFPSKYSLLGKLLCTSEEIRKCTDTDVSERLIKQLASVIIVRADDDYKLELEQLMISQAEATLTTLRQLPIGQLRRQPKYLIFILHLAFYHDLRAAQLECQASEAFEIMKDILHFGQQIFILKYLPIASLLKLLPINSCWEFYEHLFSTMKYEGNIGEVLGDVVDILQKAQSGHKLRDEYRRITIAVIESLATLSGIYAKQTRKHLDALLTIYADYVRSHFQEEQQGTSKKDKKFVQKTLAGFVLYVSTVLTKASQNVEVREQEVSQKNGLHLLDEKLRKITKIYIGHSMDYSNQYAIHLMQIALNHRKQLHFDQDEIELILSEYWRQLNEDLKQSQKRKTDNEQFTTKTIETVVKMIIGNKANEDLLLTLKNIASDCDDKENFSSITRLLTLIAKCPLSIIKGAIFNEQYKCIACSIIPRFDRDGCNQFSDYDLVINMLHCHQSVIENKTIPMSTDTLDGILAFLIDINIKKFSLCDTNVPLFKLLHRTMTEVCTALIKHRHILLSDRIPQYLHIYKDLLQAIICYKSDRVKDTALLSNELDDLAELALKLEILMHYIAQHGVAVKRVAPFVLTFIINLMVSNKRPTTLYTKVKIHIENICYAVIGICDHRVGRFILRCSNEAGRQVYELLVKNHQKYHKFRGKV